MKKYAVIYVAEYHVNTIWCKSEKNAIAVRDALKAEGYKFFDWVVDNHLNRIKAVDGIAEVAA